MCIYIYIYIYKNIYTYTYINIYIYIYIYVRCSSCANEAAWVSQPGSMPQGGSTPSLRCPNGGSTPPWDALMDNFINLDSLWGELPPLAPLRADAALPRSMSSHDRQQLWVATCSRKETVPHYDRQVTYKCQTNDKHIHLLDKWHTNDRHMTNDI